MSNGQLKMDNGQLDFDYITAKSRFKNYTLSLEGKYFVFEDGVYTTKEKEYIEILTRNKDCGKFTIVDPCHCEPSRAELNTANPEKKTKSKPQKTEESLFTLNAEDTGTLPPNTLNPNTLNPTTQEES
jgi:hypothetical protein